MIIGTILKTWFFGELVGTDVFSNRYYRSRGAKLSGREQRWVLYYGKNADASAVPPEWHSWLHHTTDVPLTERAAVPLKWQKEHQPNPSGTKLAYLPQGHDYKGGKRASAPGDYESWSPEN